MVDVKQISATLEKHGIKDYDIVVIEKRINRMVSEFGIAEKEAVSTVTRDVLKQHGVELKTSSSSDLIPLRDTSPGDWVVLEVKVVSTQKPNSPAILQSGILADDSGAMGFIIFSKGAPKPLEEGSWYRLEQAVVDSYKGVVGIKIHSGTTIKKIDSKPLPPPTIVPLAELIPGIDSFRATMLNEIESSSDTIKQSGMITDGVSVCRFVIWASSNAPPLEPGKAYVFYYANVQSYNGKISVDLSGAIRIEDDSVTIDIDSVKTDDVEMTGVIVQIQQGSGLIMRCPVEGCKRTLTRQKFCQKHEFQPDFNYDLRIKAVLDDGEDTYSLIVPRAVVERITDMTLDQAIEKAGQSPLGAEDIALDIQNMIIGRYMWVTGSMIESTFLVRDMLELVYDDAERVKLLNEVAS